MAQSKRETVMLALLALLQTVSVDGEPEIKRNEPEAEKLPSGGLIVLQDGDPGTPEETLSPVTYYWQHEAEIVVQVQGYAGAERTARLDEILVSIGGVLASDPTLGGAVDMMAASAPDFLVEAVQGAHSIQSATVTVVLEYETTSPLG